MNLVKLQDIKLIHRNLLHFYTTTKDQKEKWKKPSHLPSHQKKYNTKKSTFWRRSKTCTLKTIRCCWKKPKKAHVIELLICVQFFANTWTAACQAPLSFTISQSLLRFVSIESVMLSNCLISAVPFSSCPQSFPASGSLPMSQLFASGGQSIGVSASGLPRNIQDWFPLGWTGLTTRHVGC